MELEAAIFDFGGVLTSPILESFHEYERELGVDEGVLLLAFLHETPGNPPPYHLLEKGQITEHEFYVRMHERLRELTGRDDLEWPEDAGTVRRRLFGRLRRNEEMIESAVRIAGAYKTAILTNNVREWTEWRELASAHLFHLVIDSSEVGLRKPEPEIYLLTCERLGVRPDRAAFVDDLEGNVQGARAVGLHAIRFTSNDEVLPRLADHFPKAFVTSEPGHA